MYTYTAMIDKFTRIFIATTLLILFSKIKLNLVTSVYTFDLFIISAICITLPFLESLGSWVVFVIITQSNLLPILMPNTTLGLGPDNFAIFNSTLAFCGIIPIIVFGLIKKYSFKQSHYTDAFFGVLISWILYAIISSFIYVIRIHTPISNFIPTIRWIFTKNIFIYIFNAITLITLLPSLWKIIDGKRKKIRMLASEIE